MPGRDGTGPMGMGPITGRGAGLCNNNTFGMRYQGRTFAGYGCQRGYRRQFNDTGIPGYIRSNYTPISPNVDEKTYLISQEILLGNQLRNVKERLANMEDTEE